MRNTISAPGKEVTLTAFPNGRTRYTVVARSADGEILHTDDLNLAATKDREAFVNQLPASLRPEAARLGVGVAAQVASRAQSVAGQQATDKSLPGTALTLAPPEPWPEPVDGAVLLDEIAATLRRFVVLLAGAVEAIALWILHAHAHDAAAISPLLGLVSPEKRCGKTTTLEIIGALVPKPVIVANLSSAVLFRLVERFQPTLLADEVDTYLDGRDDLRGLLNSGHTRATAATFRCVGDDFEPRRFSTWSPKVLARIGRLPDTLHDRSIVITLQRRAPGEYVQRFRRDRIMTDLEPLRRQAARWAVDHIEELQLADPETPAELNDRTTDNWRPLLAIADAAGGAWPTRARQAAAMLNGVPAEETATRREELLHDLREVFSEQGVAELATKDVLTSLTNEMRADRPWREYRNGKPLSPAQLAELLQPFGVKPTKWRAGSESVRGYRLADLQSAFSRYLPTQSATAATALIHNDLDDPTARHSLRTVADAKAIVSAHSATPVAAVAGTNGGMAQSLPVLKRPRSAAVVLAGGDLLQLERDRHGLLRLVSRGTGRCYASAAGELDSLEVQHRLLDGLPVDVQLRQEARKLLHEACDARAKESPR